MFLCLILYLFIKFNITLEIIKQFWNLHPNQRLKKKQVKMYIPNI